MSWWWYVIGYAVMANVMAVLVAITSDGRDNGPRDMVPMLVVSMLWPFTIVGVTYYYAVAVIKRRRGDDQE